MGGRITPKSVAERYRNGWPDDPEMRSGPMTKNWFDAWVRREVKEIVHNWWQFLMLLHVSESD